MKSIRILKRKICKASPRQINLIFTILSAAKRKLAAKILCIMYSVETLLIKFVDRGNIGNIQANIVLTQSFKNPKVEKGLPKLNN